MSTAVWPEMLESINPATGLACGQVPTVGSGEVAAIVDRARSAQADWFARTWSERKVILGRWRSILSRDAEAIAELVSTEIGKPRVEAYGEVLMSLDAIAWTLSLVGRWQRGRSYWPGWQWLTMVPPARMRWRPIGVIGKWGTWNYPVLLNAPVIANALALGNAIVYKPSEHAPLVGQRLMRSLQEAGVPESLAPAIFGGPELGAALAEAEIDKGVYTGGTRGGRAVLRSLAERGVPSVVELSGFDPAIVMPDAAIPPVSRAIAWAGFLNAGQSCIAIKRVHVIGDPLPWAEAIAEQARAIRVGDPFGSEPTDIGPMITREARDRFDATIQRAIAAGARCLCGGEAGSGAGWFYEPTVLLTEDNANAEPQAILAGCFGPVVLVRGARDQREAIAQANDSAFGLAASVWGRDRRACWPVADQLQAGVVGINEVMTVTAHVAAPFGGVKASGFGRLHGELGLQELAQAQTTASRPLNHPRPMTYPSDPRADGFMKFYRKLRHPAR